MSLTIGRLTFDGPTQLDIAREGMGLRGTISHGVIGSVADARLLAEQVPHLHDRVVPVTWAANPKIDGFYRIVEATIEVRADRAGSYLADWKIDAVRTAIGTAEVELTSVGGNRSDSHSGSPERWAAPPVAALATRIGTYSPQTVTRATEDGNVTVYRSIPTGNPRWRVAPADYYDGSARLLLSGTAVEFAPGTVLDPDNLTLSNGLIRVHAGSQRWVSMEAYTGGSWGVTHEAHTADNANGDVLFTSATVLRNEPAVCAVRLVSDREGDAYHTLDVAAFRGAPFVKVLQRRASSGTLSWVMEAGESATDQSGWLQASDDTDGNAAFIGAAVNYTANTGAPASLEIAGTDYISGYTGIIPGGSTASTGNTGTDLYNQFLGVPTIKEVVLPQ